MNQTIVQVGAAARSSVPRGTRLNDIYEIEEQIAAGGMGEIYRGRLIETGDPVAIKMIKPELADNEAVLALFRKEASALHHLHHDSIVRYYVFTVDRRINRPYLAMEFVEGRALSDILRNRSLSLEEVDNLRRRIAAGLQVAHDKGIIHRDISPDNIILPEEDVKQAKIIDFGIARSTKLGQATVIGDGFAGKYNYVSPEQLGMAGGNVTGRSDMYSFALVLVEALLGKAIDMGGNQAEVIEKRRVVPDLSAVDMRIRPLLEAMLAPKPEDRPPTMTSVVEWELRGTQARQKTKTKLKTGFQTAEEPEPSSKAPLLIGAAAAVAMAAGGGWFFLRGAEPAAPSPSPSVVTAPATPPAAPNPQVAVAPPPLPRAPLDATERAARIAAYVRYYEGGQCFYANAGQVSDRSASVEALSLSEQGIQAFENDFRIVNGFAAQVTPFVVTQAQCGALALMQRLDPEPEPGLATALAQRTVKRGARVQATVAGAGDRTVEALVINEDGSVRNVTPLLRRERGQTVLDARIDDQDRTPATQKLLLTIVTPTRLEALGAATGASPTVLSGVAEEVERSGKAVWLELKAIRFD